MMGSKYVAIIISVLLICLVGIVMPVANNAESKVKEWFDAKAYPYLYIEQSQETKAAAFKDVAQRPDFLVYAGKHGVIAVDSKNKPFNTDFKSFAVSESDISLLSGFHNLFGFPVWLVFYAHGSGSTYHWMSLDDVKNFEVRTGKQEKGGAFRAVPMKFCKEIKTSDDISKLFL